MAHHNRLSDCPGYPALAAAKAALDAEVAANGWSTAARALKNDLRAKMRVCAAELGVPESALHAQ